MSVVRNAFYTDGVVAGLTVPPLALGLDVFLAAPLALGVILGAEERWPTCCQLELVSVETLRALLAHRETAAFGASISLSLANFGHARFTDGSFRGIIKLESAVCTVRAHPRLEFPLLRFFFALSMN